MTYKIPKKKDEKWVFIVIIFVFALLVVTVSEAITFLELTDTPSNYSVAFYPVAINGSSDGLAFVTIPRVVGIQSIYQNRSNITFYENGSVGITIDPLLIDARTYDYDVTKERESIANGLRITSRDSLCTGSVCSLYVTVCDVAGVKKGFPLRLYMEEIQPFAMYEWKNVPYNTYYYRPQYKTITTNNGTKKVVDGYVKETITHNNYVWKKLKGYLLRTTTKEKTLEGTINIGKNECKEFKFLTTNKIGTTHKWGLNTLDPLINSTYYEIGNVTNNSNTWDVDSNVTETNVTLSTNNKTFSLGTTGMNTTGLTNYYTFDADADDELDSINGTVNGATNSAGDGKINNGYGFDGLSDDINFGDNWDALSAFTFSMWYKTTDTGSFFLLTKWGSSDNYVWFTQTGKYGPYMAIRTTVSNYGVTYGVDTNDGNWHHDVYSWDGSTLRLFSDGVYRDSVLTSGTMVDRSNNVYSGYYERSNFFREGSIDEISVWDRAITYGGVSIDSVAGGEVAQLYNGGAGFAYPLYEYNTSKNVYTSKEIPLTINVSSFTPTWSYTPNNYNVSIQATCDYDSGSPTYTWLTSGVEASCTEGTAFQYIINLSGNTTNTPIMNNFTVSLKETTDPVPAVDSAEFFIQNDSLNKLFSVNKDTGNTTIIGRLSYDTAYGEMWFHNDSTGVTISIPNNSEYFPINGTSAGLLDDFTHDDGNLTVGLTGVYAVSYSVSFSGGGSKEYQLIPFVNGVDNEQCEFHRKMGNSGDVGNGGGTCLMSLVAGDVVYVGIQIVDSPVDDATIWSYNFNARLIN